MADPVAGGSGWGRRGGGGGREEEGGIRVASLGAGRGSLYGKVFLLGGPAAGMG
jgi:hypothetical protein